MADLTLMGRLSQSLAVLTGRVTPETAAPSRPSAGMFTRSYDQPWESVYWLTQLAINSDKVLALEGGGDMQLYEKVLDDPKCFSAFQQRRLAVVSRPWEIEPGADDARSKAASEHLRKTLDRLQWDDITDKMLYGRWYGYAVGEAIWHVDEEGLFAPRDIVVPDRKWFAFTNEGELRMRTHENADGLPVPDRKFWVIRTGGSHDFVPYGVGLAHWCYWPAWFKRNGTRFWALFLEKFGMPTALGKFPDAMKDDQEFMSKLLTTLQAIGTDAAITAPEDAQIELLEASRSGSGASSYEAFRNAMNEDLEGLILGQTMTSRAQSTGMNSNQADVHKTVRDEIVAADSDLTCETFTDSIARWMTEWNFPGAATPRLFRSLEDKEHLDAVAARDKVLKDLGWELTDEAFTERYGLGYVKVAPPPPPVIAAPVPGQPRVPGQPGPQFAVGEERTAYVSRKVLNAEKIIAWAKSAGFPQTLAAADMHVTIAYSKRPFDWLKVGPDWTSDKDGRVIIKPGGPRLVEQIGDANTVALMLGDIWDLSSRNREISEAGASWDHDGYHAHISLTYEAPADLDLTAITAYDGEIILGPERWEPLNEDWSASIDETAFTAERLDAVDRTVALLMADGRATFAAMLAPIRAKLRGVKDPGALRVALLEAAERMSTDQFAAAMADANLAVRAISQAGIGEPPTPEE